MVKRAVQFACNNALICETSAEARELVFGDVGRGARFRAVSLDGTQYTATGAISGGNADLRAKAKQWDEDDIR